MQIAIVANKTWECDPLVSALLARDARPAALTNDMFRRGYDPAEAPSEIAHAPPPEEDGRGLIGRLPIRPRLRIAAPALNLDVEVWCIEDWMRFWRSRPVQPGKGQRQNTSSSYEKFTFALPQIKKNCFQGKAPDLVLAFGTAGIVSDITLNGSVTIGSRVYVHDAWIGASEDEIKEQVEKFGPLLRDEIADHLEDPINSPRLKDSLFASDISTEVRFAAEARFLTPPINPARPPRILAGHGYASLGTINICNYDDYVWADEETLRLFKTEVRQREIGSMETTHGLIRLTWKDTPFLFISGITDRVPMFNAEVTPRKYSQNFACAHNAGVATAHLLVELARLGKDKILNP